jgi:hypothetical protein
LFCQKWEVLFHWKILEVYFDQFEFLEWFSDKPTIFSTLEREKIVMHFPHHLPQHFEYLFHFPSLFLNSPATDSCWRFDTRKIPGRHHSFHLHCPRGKEKIWKLYKTSDKIFLFSAKNLLLFLNNFYKFHAQNK